MPPCRSPRWGLGRQSARARGSARLLMGPFGHPTGKETGLWLLQRCAFCRFGPAGARSLWPWQECRAAVLGLVTARQATLGSTAVR